MYENNETPGHIDVYNVYKCMRVSTCISVKDTFITCLLYYFKEFNKFTVDMRAIIISFYGLKP